MKTILLGTSNPSKVEYFRRQLADHDAAFLTPRDLGVRSAPDENGRDPLENAKAKAAWYGQYHDYVISADSALYIRELPLDDPRQPGLFIRRRPDGSQMDDEAMIAHYAALAKSLGGRMTCWYQDATAVYHQGKVSGFMDTGPVNDVYAFIMVDKPHPIRTPGWPLDSLSIRPCTGRYFVESRDHQMSAAQEVLAKAYADELVRFWAENLGLEKKQKE